MTTNYHTPVATGAPANAAIINSPLAQLDAAITALIFGVTLINKSGGALAAGDCVIIDSSNNESVTTTTAAGDTRGPCIILTGGAADAEITATQLGEVTVVVDQAATRGQYIKTSTTAKQVTPTSNLEAGVFGILTTASTGGTGTTAKAVLLGGVVPNVVSASIVDAKGDLLVGTADNALSRLAIGINDQVLITDSTQPAGMKWGAVPTHTHAASAITSGQLALARGGTNADLSATGGSSPTQYLKQASAGATITVGAIAAADLPAASETAQGAAELATSAEVETGTDTAKVVTPAGLSAKYYKKSEHLDVSVGAGDAGKPVKLDGGGKIDATMINPPDIDHAQLSNLTIGDPHTQYILKSILTTKGDILTRDASGNIVRLAAGASTQVLSADPSEPTGLKWVPQVSSGSGIPGSTIDAKGDLIVGTADDTYSRLPVGANGQYLRANSSQAMGVEWATNVAEKMYLQQNFI